MAKLIEDKATAEEFATEFIRIKELLNQK